jgi:(S)-citramalyl-CoA lyase
VIDVLDEAGSTAGIIPMVELARGVFAADRMAQTGERVCGLFLGGGGLAADLGAEGAWENLLYARSCLVAAAATTGIAAIDVPYFQADDAGLEREATASRKLGMTGKAALHADQLPTINTIFTPSAAAIAHARAVIAAEASTRTPVLDGKTIEPAMVREANRAMAIAARAGMA